MEGDVRMLMVNKPSVTIALNITRTTTVTVTVQAIDRLGSSSTEVERNITFFPKIESKQIMMYCAHDHRRSYVTYTSLRYG